ncbi:bifunctional (p)ppGpp synthetase/guanosine-3',5'-bis(diphosphate) 3'-pyrophosphohydrolase [Candidatus Tisiphia endosymbiont of Beris chalybata]|uniref:bifunctional (p)ppGpp synthetase/guanosine-3',5'-bis(diphosphate) 3'-pyrophosphohydrolase n=1 Tax=Candidatus Tisiphia endosymbiont of Beris chalybata TaxID=3066262 RepID=UPI00312C7E79
MHFMLYDYTESLYNIISTIRMHLSQNYVTPKISYRLKDPYSILKKMIRKGIDIQELTDVIAIRIIVETKEDCYKSLGIINYIYQINLEKLKDFISNPKGNGYQSLHVVVVNAFPGRNIEIQIRTNQMHKIAEFGAANHNEYKKEQGERIKRLFNTVRSKISVHKAYKILEEFDWTTFDLMAYEKEIKNLWHYCLINLHEIQKQLKSDRD